MKKGRKKDNIIMYSVSDGELINDFRLKNRVSKIIMNKKKSESRRRRSVRGQKSVLYRHRKSMMIIGAVLGLLMGVAGVGSVRLYARNESYKEQEAELEAQIEEAKKRSEEVKAYEEYVKTDEYIKDVAEEKLGLVDPNEIIFKPRQ